MRIHSYFRLTLPLLVTAVPSAALAQLPLDPKLGPNLRLGDDPPLLPPGLRAQVEPHVIRSFFDPSLLVATFQEGRYENGAAVAGGYSVSTDGGLSWSRALIPGLTQIDGGPYFRAADSVAGIDLAGNVYLSHVVFGNAQPPPTATVVSRSADRGQSFSAPNLVFSALPETDKTWMTINTFPQSATANRIVVMGNVFGDGRDQLHFSFSDDQGTTWSPRRLAGPTQGVFCNPFFLPDGSLGVVYFHYLDNLFETFANARIEFMRSEDGRPTFAAPVIVTPMTGLMYHDPIARDAWDVPSACTDRQAGVIYVTYQALIGPPTNKVPRIMFTRSNDRGQTWVTPVAVNDTPDRRGVFNPCIAASPDGQHLSIAFYDKRHQTPSSANNLVDYYLAESFDGGESWEANLRLSEVSSDLRKAPATGSGRMLADYQGIVPALNFDTPGVAVWIDTRDGDPDPYAVSIARTRGTTFETWRRLRFSPSALADPSLSGEGADPDGDGLANLLEYALGREPAHPDPNPVSISYHSRFWGWHVSYEYLAVLSDIEKSWQVSTDLVDWQTWTPVLDDGSISVSHGDPSRMVFRATIASAAPATFYRLRVTRRSPDP